MKKHMKMTLRKQIVGIGIIPVLLLGIVTMILSLTIVQDALINEVKDSLKSAAVAVRSAYDQNSGEYFEAQNGYVWKGNYNISKSEDLVDRIKEEVGMEVTFFYGDRRIVTSAVDEDGKRILGSPAGETVKNKVLEQGEEFFSDNVSIDGTMYYGYYIPVYGEGVTKPIGMVFVGAEKESKIAAIYKIIGTVIAGVLGVMVLAIIVAGILGISISKATQKSIGIVEEVAKGNLTVEVEKSSLKRKDEVGDLTRAVEQLEEKLSESICGIEENAVSVMESAQLLDKTTRMTTESMEQMDRVMESIAESATNQAGISMHAAENVTEMGNKIQETTVRVQEMKSDADKMYQAEQEAVETLERLLGSNRSAQELIGEISEQTQQTNESARKIKQALDIIVSIADETSLLSLNASIEAARAGEQGRGFAVVAEQIQHLAMQSNEASVHIGEIVMQLVDDSNKAVEIMGKVTKTMSDQTIHMQQIQDISGEVMQKIQNSMGSMNTIEQSVQYLDGSRKELVDTMAELADIASENAATTQEVSTTTTSVKEQFDQVEKSTNELKNIADQLKKNMEYFQV